MNKNTISRAPMQKTSSLILAVSLMGLSTMSAQAYDRIAVISPDVSDVIVELGAAKKVVGKNAMNRNPKLKHAKTVGSHRNVTAETILSVKPDLVLGSYMVQPQSVFQRLQKFKIEAVNVAPKEDVETFAQSIKQIGRYVDKKEEGDKLSKKWSQGMKQRKGTGKRYLLTYDGRTVAGTGTVGDKLITAAGGINAGAVVKGFKPLTREAWLEAKPDIIIIAKHNLPIIGSRKKFLSRPEVATSPAGKTQAVYFWSANDYLRYGLNSPNVVENLYKLAQKK